MSKNKYPGLSTQERVDLKTDIDTPFPIASISKSFCGAVCALMSVDDDFGAKGIDATLGEVLESAKSKYPDRTADIEAYSKMLEERGFLDIKISELLTHRSGIEDNDELAPSSCIGQTPLDFFSSYLRSSSRGEYKYSNNGYVLLEEIINLVSQKGSYQSELYDRIFAKLELENSGVLEDVVDKKSAEAKKHLGQAVFVVGAKQNPHSEKIVEVHTEFPANHTTPLGPVSTSCGGLYCSVADLTKFSDALARMVMGLENPLTDKATEVSALYCGQLEGSANYSLGVEFEKGESNCVMTHKGLFPGNIASMAVLLPCGFEELKSGATPKEVEDFKMNIYMQKFDDMTSSLFTQRAGDALQEVLAGFNSNLKNLEEFQKAWIEIVVRSNAVRNYLIENYLNEDGVIDSDRIHADFRDIESVDAVVVPLLEQTKKQASEELKTFREKFTTSIDALDLAESSTSWAQRIKQQKEERAKSSGSHEV